MAGIIEPPPFMTERSYPDSRTLLLVQPMSSLRGFAAIALLVSEGYNFFVFLTVKL